MATRQAQQVVATANDMAADAFVAEFVRKSYAQLRYQTASGTDIHIDIKRSDHLSPIEIDACFALVEETSAAAYKTSSRGWKPKEKKAEMVDPVMWYLLTRQVEDAPPVGFASFMITIEDDYPVVYLYEIHLSDSLRGAGVGAHLMSVVETVGFNAGMDKVMLTVFTSNERAECFYRKRGYETDEFSPQPRRLRGGKVKRPDYVILSKSLR